MQGPAYMLFGSTCFRVYVLYLASSDCTPLLSLGSGAHSLRYFSRSGNCITLFAEPSPSAGAAAVHCVVLIDGCIADSSLRAYADAC